VVVKEDWPLFVHTLILRQLWRLTKAARRSDEASFRTTEKAIAAISVNNDWSEPKSSFSKLLP